MTVISFNNTDSDRAVIEGCAEVLQQGLDCLNRLTGEQYAYVAKPHMMSSIGAHYRHFLDVFHALIKGSNMSVVDYNLRRRGHIVETSIEVARTEIQSLLDWLLSLNSAELRREVMVVNEVSVSYQRSSETKSTLGREITFSSLHANHHYAMIKVALSLINVESNELFGIAPATASYMRG